MYYQAESANDYSLSPQDRTKLPDLLVDFEDRLY